MRFTCSCGKVVTDTSDSIPWKGRLIPDQRWNGVFDTINEKVLGKLAANSLAMNDAKDMVFDILLANTRKIQQCEVCGRIYISRDVGWDLECYAPETPSTCKKVLRGTTGEV